MKGFLILIMLTLGLGFYSCDSASNSCVDKVCGNNATCDDGVCECDPGYEVNINGLCVPTNPCTGVTCGQDSICVNGNCEPVIIDPCASINCQNGTCDNGVCDCDPGYGQDSTGVCTMLWGNNFIGAWLVNDNCTANNYAVTVSRNGIRIIDFQNFQDDFYVSALMTSANTFEISAGQYYSGTLGRSLYIESVGQGTLNAAGTEMNVVYKTTDLSTNTIQTCTSTWTR